MAKKQPYKLLTYLPFISYFESKFSWDSDYVFEKLSKIKTRLNNIEFDNNDFIKDLKLAIALWVEDNGVMAFAHRSLQEYFAALSVKHLNPAQNERIYDKIITRFSSIRSLNEVENFLSLCEEMDVVNFKRHYLIPLMHELKAVLDPTSDKSLGVSFLTFFCSAINFKPNQKSHIPRPVEINDEIVYKAIYIHLPFTKKLYNYLQDAASADKLAACQGEDKQLQLYHKNQTIAKVETIETDEIVRQIRLNKNNIPDDFWNICGQGIIDISKDFYSFLEKSIRENEDYIKRSDELDKNLVDLI